MEAICDLAELERVVGSRQLPVMMKSIDRLAVITSRDGDGQADASPKGDPPGVIRPIGPTTVAVADRPGNRRTDTFHNVLEQPDVAIVALAPGDDRVLELTGTASVSADPALREPMAERGRTPKAVLLVEVARAAQAQRDGPRCPSLGRRAACRPGRTTQTRRDLDRPRQAQRDHRRRREAPAEGGGRADDACRDLRGLPAEPVLSQCRVPAGVERSSVTESAVSTMIPSASAARCTARLGAVVRAACSGV